MEYRDSETQKLLRDTARSYLSDKFPVDRLYAMESGQDQLTAANVREFAQLGWLGILAPESVGGSGGSLLEAAVLSEEFGYGGVPAPVTFASVAADLLAHAADQAGVTDHLKDLVTGGKIYTLSEATRRKGRLSYYGKAPGQPLAATAGKLSGVLPTVPYANLANFVLGPLAIDGEAAYAVIPLEGTRLEQTKLLDKADYYNVHIDGSDLSASLVLARGKQAEALHEEADALVTGLTSIELVGAMQKSLEVTSEYISNRVQFGVPIAKFQAARHRAAEMLMYTETSRWAAYHALSSFESDRSDTREIWLAKHWLIRGAEFVYKNSHMLHGGIGVGMEYPLHLYTQPVAAGIARAGNISEMTSRLVETLNLRPQAV